MLIDARTHDTLHAWSWIFDIVHTQHLLYMPYVGPVRYNVPVNIHPDRPKKYGGLIYVHQYIHFKYARHGAECRAYEHLVLVEYRLTCTRQMQRAYLRSLATGT